MEREFSQAVSIAIQLMATAAIIGLIFFTVGIGSQIQTSSASSLESINKDVKLSVLHDLATGATDNEMPKATAFNILKTYGGAISMIECTASVSATGATTYVKPSDNKYCVETNLSGRVILEVFEMSGGGQYTAKLTAP